MDEPEARSVSQWWGGPPGGPPLASFSALLPYTQCGYDLPSGYRRELSRGGTPHSCRALAERRPRRAGRDCRLLSAPAVSLPAAAGARPGVGRRSVPTDLAACSAPTASLRCGAQLRYLALRHRAQCRHGSAAPASGREPGRSRIHPSGERSGRAQHRAGGGARRHSCPCPGGSARALCRETLTLRFEEGMKLEEIAEVTHAPLSTVKSRVRRGLEAMRQKLCKEDIL